ncbi:hypothetical protein RI129_006575 [Pyrocoelia pectoralis]|uniref:Centriolar and ciliogenesis-associated protein HYLS1 C-terminal domain-containing protein n=1 Tax=Pyrocoelia pectoralis TaxID=417401 RepID=A0AAN7ZGA8_9COLE
MSSINPREVLQYLNELGFHNITREQLKVFIQDLKRLIKYENKADAENIPPPCPCDNKPTHTLPTESWLYKQREFLGNKVLLKVNHKVPQNSVKSNSTVCSRNSGECSDLTPCGSNCVWYKLDGSSAPDILRIDDTVINVPARSKSCESLRKSKNPNVKYKQKSVILPRPPQKMTKCDPVTLYHKYQEEWKKHNIPGEADHAELRWSIRERLLGQPKIVRSFTSVLFKLNQYFSANDRVIGHSLQKTICVVLW